jgi:hypothetical protein
VSRWTIHIAVVVEGERPDPNPMAEALLQYDGVVEVRAKQPVERKHPPGRQPDERQIAESWLRWFLKQNGQVPTGQVYEAAEARNITRRTLRRAADRIGVVRHPPHGGPRTTWSLPEVTHV